ncbi:MULTISPECIES: hypothetical protein [unclassified Streptomyces]|uniref:hypothetical protein n=1 Tax=unclassified Streptomyces TaxID=2593676 RepID=UPI0022AF5531|nr:MULTISPECIES: hypothetical protein [unclassified Streptomyces]MCZ4097304.1 hypothetical protein [Streptomyces sp. H39-C1]MCZ4120608.1 hypothetical protein [Streptomyces sp. H39-S7]
MTDTDKDIARASRYGLIDFVRTHPARVYSVLASALALAAVYVPGLPREGILAVLAAMLGGGEIVQRFEDGKTLTAAQLPTDDATDTQLPI